MILSIGLDILDVAAIVGNLVDYLYLRLKLPLLVQFVFLVFVLLVEHWLSWNELR